MNVRLFVEGARKSLFEVAMNLIDVRKVSEMLSVKPSTVYQWAELGQIPCVKLNGAVRFDPDDICKWIESCKKQTSSGYNALAQTHQRPRKGGPV